MGGPLSVILADIHMIRTENSIVRPSKPLFYKIYVDDIYNRRKKNVEDKLFNKLNNYHSNIKLTIEKNSNKFLDTEIINNNGHIITKGHRKPTKLPIHGHQKYLKGTKEMLLMEIYIAQNELLLASMMK